MRASECLASYENSVCYNLRMGSGQGKSRRGQTVKPQLEDQAVRLPDLVSEARPGTKAQTITRTTLTERNWVDFLSSGGLEQVRVYQYYLGGNVKRKYSVDEHERVVGELFRDAVEVGAITLPSKYDREDFEFRSEEHTSELQSLRHL